MGSITSQITSPTIVYSGVYSGADHWKHQSYASLAFVRGIHRRPVNSPHKGPETWKMFPFDDVIMKVSVMRYFNIILDTEFGVQQYVYSKLNQNRLSFKNKNLGICKPLLLARPNWTLSTREMLFKLLKALCSWQALFGKLIRHETNRICTKLIAWFEWNVTVNEDITCMCNM